jgi:hypothetical protein
MKYRNQKYSSSRSPKSVSSVLNSTLKAFRLTKQAEKYAAFKHWPEIVGTKFAHVTMPEKISRGKILIVKVENTAIMQELNWKKQEFIDKINGLPVGAYIEDIRFKASDPVTMRNLTSKNKPRI